MGSSLSSPLGFDEDGSRSQAKNASIDPMLEKLRKLKVVPPILKQQTTDSSLSDLLLRRSSSQTSEALDPKTTVELFRLYQEWQQATAAKVGKNQEELGHKIIGVEELSMKLLQRLNYATRVMEASAAHLREIHSLQIEISEMKANLTETLGNYEKLGHKVSALGLHNKDIKQIVNQLHCDVPDQDVNNFISPSEISAEEALADA